MARLPSVEPLPWPDFLEWWGDVWEPGDHVGIIAPTHAGKTTLALGLLSPRKFVLAFDPKGGDSTLQGSGFPRLPAWPPPKEAYKAMREGRPVKYLVGPVVRVPEDVIQQVAVQAAALQGAFSDTGWTVYVDELQLLADRRMMGLGVHVERLLISARDKAVSVVTSFQRPANVPRTASDQAAWLAISYTRDVDVVNRLAEMLGRPKAEIRGVMNGLDPYTWLIVGRNPREPYRVTRPAEIKRKVAEAV